MHEQIRRFEHRAEQLAIRLETLAERSDISRIAMAGVLSAAVILWFAVAWGEGVLLLGLPLVAGGCVLMARRHEEHDPAVDEPGRVLGPERKEIDEWLNRLTAAPARPDPAPPRASFVAPTVTFSVPASAPEVPSAQSTIQREQAPILREEDTLPNPEPEFEQEPTAIYEVREIRAGAAILLEVRASFEAAVDAAFDLIEERDPPELEVVSVRGAEREVSWTYSKDATIDRPRGTLDLFGFDATRWTGTRR
jgi:hypothetical protein